ncbi:MAG: extracellular solute-binding protein, partial [Candidatus Omnitrophica bacterium]|nr:extracellular solute-binding protein [Candidatus Omnitrophota bacterium]
KVYAVPTSTDSRVMYYHKDLLESAAGNPNWKLFDENGNPRPPLTWEEMKSHNRFFVRRDERGALEQVGYLPDQGNCYLYMYGFQNGGHFMNMEENRCTLNDPKIVEALEYMCDIYADYSPEGDDRIAGRKQAARFSQAFQGGVNQPFLEGQLAFWVDTEGFMSIISRYKPNLNFGVIPVPHPADREPVTWSGGWSLVIPKGVPDDKARLAWSFIRWMTSPEANLLMTRYQRDYNRSKGRLSVPSMSANRIANEAALNNIILTDPDLGPAFKDGILTAFSLLPVSKFRPVTPVGQILWDKQYYAVDQASFGNATPKEILDRYTQDVNTEIERMEHSPPPIDTTKPWSVLAIMVVLFLVYIVWSIKKQSSLGQVSRQEALWGYVFLSPWLIGFIVFMAGPILASVFLSFTQYDVLHTPRWVGLDNYRHLLGLDVVVNSWFPWKWEWNASDPLFWKSVWNTIYMLLAVPLMMILGLAIALLLQQEVRMMATYRTLFYLPAIVPFVASAVLWLFVLRPEGGLLNEVIEGLFPIKGPDWLAGQETAKPAIILMMLWGSGATMIIWLAGLKGISPHYYESAILDGAGFFRKLFNITLPLLSPYILYNLIMGTIGILQIFTQAMVMTYGGPADATTFYAYYLFNNAFFWFRMGIASAMAWILLIATLILTLIQLRSSQGWVYYEGEEE